MGEGTKIRTSIQSIGLSFLVSKFNTEDFLLANTVQGIAKTSSGLCPHGCAPSACPVCSGMGGGSMRMGERPQKAGEMSYHQCAIIGAMMRAREARLEAHEKNLQSRMDALKTFEAKLEQISARIAEFTAQLSNKLLLKPVAFVVNFVTTPVINALKTATNTIINIAGRISQIKEKFIDIQDKLNAIFGEAKAFIEKKVSEFVKAVKSKLEGLFRIFKKHNTDDEDTKIDDDKKIFNLKRFIQKIRKKKKDDTED